MSEWHEGLRFQLITCPIKPEIQIPLPFSLSGLAEASNDSKNRRFSFFMFQAHSKVLIARRKHTPLLVISQRQPLSSAYDECEKVFRLFEGLGINNNQGIKASLLNGIQPGGIDQFRGWASHLQHFGLSGFQIDLAQFWISRQLLGSLGTRKQ